MNINFKELKLANGNKLVAYFANNRGLGTDNVTLYVIPGNVERKGSCRSQEKEPWIFSARTSAWRGKINLSERIMAELHITRDQILVGECEYCGGQGLWYGMAPHTHDLKRTGSIIGSTVVEPKKKWPDNFTEDPEASGCGVYSCEYCNGSGHNLKKPYDDLD